MNSNDTSFDAAKFRYDINLFYALYTNFYLTLHKYIISHLECNIHQIEIKDVLHKRGG